MQPIKLVLSLLLLKLDPFLLPLFLGLGSRSAEYCSAQTLRAPATAHRLGLLGPLRRFGGRLPLLALAIILLY